MSDSNRVTDPIQSQSEADGLRAGLGMRKAIPPDQLSPVMEDAIALDEARLAQWDAHHPTTEAANERQEAD
jgi:hypothetical protein